MVTRCCGFRGGIFLKVNSFSAIMLKTECVCTIHWLRDQPFEQGMIKKQNIHIYIEREMLTVSSEEAWVYETWQK